ncbi:MAG: iron-sulfur containing oxygenase [Betaproteobacteria bacterium]|nr:iron-sulfur containing oxygenase [Betaproteobacteria bacterium]
MGKLLRNFWQPVALSSSIEKGRARPLRILSEDLTLYRGDGGTPYLVAERCAHRCTVLHTGWVEGEQIRCMYHGWKFDGTGQCTEMPAEKRPRPELVKIVGYPLHEYCGLVFAYMGEGPAPAFDLPRKDCLEEPGRLLFNRLQVWDCNWFQQIENTMDGSHVSFVHVWGKMSRFGEEVTQAVPDLAYEESDAGIKQTATRSKSNVRVNNWTFPNNNHVLSPGPTRADAWPDTSIWPVPIDDHSTARFAIITVPSDGGESDRHHREDRLRELNPVDYYGQLFNQRKIPDAGPSMLIATQDYVAMRGQGVIVDRGRERLAQSDAGIAFLRRIFLRELEAIQRGRPGKRWRRLEKEPEMPIQVPETAGR